MSRFPIMPLYCSDLLTDTHHLSPELFGSYVRILCAMWNNEGVLPDDDHYLARVVGVNVRKWKAMRAAITAFLMPCGDGWLTQKKLLKIRRKLIEKSSNNAQSANARWAKSRQNRSRYNGAPNANAHANADATRAGTHIQIEEPSLSSSVSADLPHADALGASPTGPPPSIPVSDALLNTKLVKKGPKP